MNAIIISTVGIIGLSIVIPAHFLYASKGKHTINYPGCNYWKIELKHKVNRLFLNVSLSIFAICETGIVSAIILNSFNMISLNQALIIAITISLLATALGIPLFFILVNKIIKSAQQGDAPECRT